MTKLKNDVFRWIRFEEDYDFESEQWQGLFYI